MAEHRRGSVASDPNTAMTTGGLPFFPKATEERGMIDIYCPSCGVLLFAEMSEASIAKGEVVRCSCLAYVSPIPAPA